ncbi:IS481 family transposase [Actinomadura sp. CNU-125]|uniref:IS481 family transposase n=1 Tax=Actinomadura sp. CNU-125 TaxID=1904961 RepID=UPI000967EC90|nr:IS481 family transposase [Actinomadura sp. CNU-125]OLT30486.1 IS481 family transposase [Actinomadura sp. CNU-125]
MLDDLQVADGDEGFDERAWRVEHRYRAVLEVLDGVPVAQVARQFGASRQSVHNWLRRFEAEGMDGLVEQSRRPKNSPARLPAEVEALICELRRAYPRWGPRRIAHELGLRGVDPAPGRTTVYRVLTRNGLVQPQQQTHRRSYRRWQRDAPMQLWQLDIMGGIFLAGGRECKLVTGIDDHSRFVVVAQVVAEPSGRAVCQAFTEAMGRYGVPSEVLTDNGKQFTGRFTKPFPAEVMFERICRENGITARLTKPRSPTTTGKIERWHGSLRRELLDGAGAFESMATAQAGIEAWVHAYNHGRPHQSLNMATPVSVFRPTPASEPAPKAIDPPLGIPATRSDQSARSPVPQPQEPDRAHEAVEFDMVITPSGRLCLPGNQQIKFNAALGGHPVTIWADLRSIHVLLGGELIRTRASRLSPQDLAQLRLRGGRPAGSEPAASAAPRGPLPTATAIEVDRTVGRDGDVQLAGHRIKLEVNLAGQRVILRLDQRLMHVIASGLLVKTLPVPLVPDQAAKLNGARTTRQPLPPPPAPPLQAIRKVPADGITMVAGQRLRVGRAHAGKTVTVVIDDTVFRVLHNDIELSVHPRKSTGPIKKYRH